MLNSYKFSLLSVLALSFFSLAILAQETDTSTVDAEAEGDQVEEIIVLGSRIARNPLDLAQPNHYFG